MVYNINVYGLDRLSALCLLPLRFATKLFFDTYCLVLKTAKKNQKRCLYNSIVFKKAKNTGYSNYPADFSRPPFP